MAYNKTAYMQPISPQGRGAVTVASYKPIDGLGTPFPAGHGVSFARQYAQPVDSWSGGGNSLAHYRPIGRGAPERYDSGYTQEHSPYVSTVSAYKAIHGLGADAPLSLGRVLFLAGAAAALGTGLWLAFKPGGFLRNGRKYRRNGRWSTKRKNTLPDSAFLYVEPGGRAHIESSGKVTVPRSYRHFPYKNSAGNVDIAHLRNAISRIPRSNIPAGLKAPLQAKARSLLASHGGYARARRGAGGVLRKAA